MKPQLRDAKYVGRLSPHLAENENFGDRVPRVGHFSVGFYAFGIAEYLLGRNKMSRTLACVFAIFSIAFVAMSYELLERIYAAYGGDAQAGADFLGSQGDIWHAQKDMLMDTLGGIASLILYLVLRGRRTPPSKLA